MTFNGWTFFFQVLNFVVLAYILHRLLYRPLQKAIDQRRRRNEQAQVEAEKAQQEAQALRHELECQLADLERRRQEMIQTAQSQAGENARRLLEEAGQALQRQREEARQALARERDEALAQLHGEVLHQALELTRRLLGEASGHTLHEQLAQRLTDTLTHLSPAEKQQVREQAHPGDEAVLESAEPVAGELLDQLTAAAHEVLGREARPTVQCRPALLAGVRLRLAGRVWDCSLAGQLPEAGELLSREGAA